MHAFAKGYLDGAGEVDGFILKSRSPSCGITDTKVHDNATDPTVAAKAAGMFGAAVIERYPHAAIESEDRLTSARLRHHFLTKLFLRERFRMTRARRAIAALVGFHSANKYLLMTYHQESVRTLGRIVANESKDTADRVFGSYAAQLGEILARPARLPATVNAFMHLLGYFSDRLTANEKAQFLDILTQFREKRVSIDAPLEAVQHWVTRFDNTYIGNQTLLDPYPRELLVIG
jgi:uncharacterized protein YbgA (DUF1722 family)